MEELFDRIRASGDQPLRISLEELIALETWLKTHRGYRSFSEMQKAARGDQALKAKLEAETAWRNKLRFTAEYNRNLQNEGVPAAGLQATTTAPPVAAHPGPSEARTLADCPLEFWPDRIGLLGETLALASARGNNWVILQALRQAHESKTSVAVKTGDLAKKFVPVQVKDAAVTLAVWKLRGKIGSILEKHGIQANGKQVVVSVLEGYAFAAGLKVVSHDRDPDRKAGLSAADERLEPATAQPDPGRGSGGADVPAGTRDVPPGTLVVPPGTAAVPPDPTPPKSAAGSPQRKQATAAAPVGAAEREAWILKALRGGRKLHRADVEGGLGIGEKTAKRLLASLTRAGFIEWVATPKPGHYRLVRKR